MTNISIHEKTVLNFHISKSNGRLAIYISTRFIEIDLYFSPIFFQKCIPNKEKNETARYKEFLG